MRFALALPGRVLLAALCLALPACSTAPAPSAQAPGEPCDVDLRLDRGQVAACEVRTLTLDRDDLALDASPNGSIEVSTWDRPTVEVQARVVAVAPSRAEAERRVAATRVTTGSTVRAELPDADEGWTSVEFTARVPRDAALELDAVNGQIAVRGVRGAVRASSVNGQVVLDDVGGAVEARTVNGRVEVVLSGVARGRVDVSTVNGSAEVAVPARYAADVDLRSTMGSVRVRGLDLPEPACEPAHACRGQVRGALGGGGPALSVSTTNGSVLLRRR